MFAYSAYNVAGRNGAGGAPYENANELVVLHAPSYFRMFRATSNQNIDTTDVYEAAYSWTHVAIVWAADPSASPHGQLSHYINGNLTANLTACACMRRVLTTHACDENRSIHPTPARIAPDVCDWRRPRLRLRDGSAGGWRHPHGAGGG